jgi:DNA polymerase-1
VGDLGPLAAEIRRLVRRDERRLRECRYGRQERGQHADHPNCPGTGDATHRAAKSLDIAQDEAAAFIDAYFARYVGVGKFFSETLAQCNRLGYVSTMLGRRRAIQGVRMPDPSIVDGNLWSRRPLSLPERTAVNTVIQGSAADMIKLAMIAIARQLRDEQRQSKMILQIHDELVFEVPADELDEVATLVTHAMQTVLPLRVPLKIDVKSGDNWAECEPWTA